MVRAGAVREDDGGVFRVGKAHQIGVFADFCNECGNCDVFCPEDGGPYLVKPRFFGSLAQWEKWRALDGLFVESSGGIVRVRGRVAGDEYALEMDMEARRSRMSDRCIEAIIDLDAHRVLEATALPGAVEGHVLPIDRYHALRVLACAVSDASLTNPVNAINLPL